MSDHERRRRLVKAVTDTITRSSARDEQKSVGPSEIGDPCGRCLGQALCRKYPELWWDHEPPPADTFSLKAWVGTAAHEKLERELEYPGAVKEITVPITHLPEYGDISGHCDLYAERTVLDYKTKDLHKIRELKLQGRPPVKELVQTNLYGHGARQTGHAVEDLCLFYIPRDSNRLDDCFPAFLTPNEEVVRRSLERLAKVWELVRNGKGHELTAHADCYRCVVRYRIVNRRDR